MGIEHFIDRMENATELHRGLPANYITDKKNRHRALKRPYGGLIL